MTTTTTTTRKKKDGEEEGKEEEEDDDDDEREAEAEDRERFQNMRSGLLFLLPHSFIHLFFLSFFHSFTLLLLVLGLSYVFVFFHSIFLVCFRLSTKNKPQTRAMSPVRRSSRMFVAGMLSWCSTGAPSAPVTAAAAPSQPLDARFKRTNIIKSNIAGEQLCRHILVHHLVKGHLQDVGECLIELEPAAADKRLHLM